MFPLRDHRHAVRVRVRGVEVLRGPGVVRRFAVELLPHHDEFLFLRLVVLHDARANAGELPWEREECTRGATRVTRRE